jgi:glycosyltransferase involved in cell wall biosynthesis
MLYKIAVVVHGRFHAFDLARELLYRGHDVTLFTNYSGRTAEQFGIPRHRVHSFLTHGLTTRTLFRTSPARVHGLVERLANPAFGRWAARKVLRENWDVVVAFTGVAEETFLGLGNSRTLKVLQRGSSHIRMQRQILEEEERRLERWVEKPSDWIIAREEREYALADIIHLLSTFAMRSFQDLHAEVDKLYHIWLGVQTSKFRPTPDVIEERCRRILSGAPLRVLYVGNFSSQKGVKDFETAIQALGTERFSFRFVGPVASDARPVARRLRRMATFTGKRPQFELPQEYRWGDIFVFPTLQDGFAVVLTQALASGLPLLATTNCAGPDLIQEGEQGWIVPIRSPDAIVERLRWCDLHREELAQVVRNVYERSWSFDWKSTAEQAECNFITASQWKQMACDSNHKAHQAEPAGSPKVT